MASLEQDLRRLAKEQDVLLTEDEFQSILNSLKSVLEAFGKIDEADVLGIEPLVHAFDLEERLREDEARKTDWNPHCNSKEFTAPPIIEDE